MKECIFKSICKNVDTDICGDSCSKYLSMKYLLDHSEIPESKQQPIILEAEAKDLEAFTRLKEIKTGIRDFVRQGKNLIIYSANTGNGKTSWALKILMHYFETIYWQNQFRVRGMFVNVPTLLTQLKDFEEHPINQEYLDNLANADLVVWDDLGVTPATNYDNLRFYSILSQRELNGKSNIFTSNVSLEDLAMMYDKRIISRISNATVIEIKGGDRRNGNC